MFYAHREPSKSAAQHRNLIKAFASNRKLRLQTNSGWLALLSPQEYEALVAQTAEAEHDRPTGVVRPISPISVQDAWRRGRIREKLPDGFDEQARAVYRELFGETR